MILKIVDGIGENKTAFKPRLSPAELTAGLFYERVLILLILEKR